MYVLHIANRNYSSWSLRPWLLLRMLGIPFEERMVPFHDTAAWERFRALSPNAKVPLLVDGDTVVWESLAIVEYLAERHPGVWPDDPLARAWARSAAAEMHAGFGELRTRCSMSCGQRVRLREVPASLQRDLDRLSALWRDGQATWIGTPHGLHRMRDDGTWDTPAWAEEFRGRRAVSAMSGDGQGGYWVATTVGLWHVPRGGQPVAVGHGFDVPGPNSVIQAMLHDVDGGLWVG